MIKDNNVYLRDQDDDNTDTHHLGRLVATTGSDHHRQMLKTGADGDGGDIMIQDDVAEQKKKGQQPDGAKSGDPGERS